MSGAKMTGNRLTLKDKQSWGDYPEYDGYFYSKDVKEAVLEFEMFINEKYSGDDPYGYIMDKFYEIFGDFENE